MKYPYHNRIKQRIKNNEYVSFELVENYPGIGKCAVLHFNTKPYTRPIRPYRYAEYIELIPEFITIAG